MKNLTQKQIDQVINLRSWSQTKFHGNTKKVGSLSVNDIKSIISKKQARNYAKIDTAEISNVQLVRKLINQSLKCKGTNYCKIMIEGTTGIYYASADYGHSDYNKSRLFAKNNHTIKLMNLFNSIINKSR
jgi:hypothetical protein